MRTDTLLFIVFAFILASNTFWLFESPLKYAFYVFEFTLMLSLYYLLNRKRVLAYPSSADPKGASTRSLACVRKIGLAFNGDVASKIDYTLSIMSLILLAFTMFGLSSILNIVFAIAVSFFMPGYVVLRSLKFHFLNTWIEWLVLAFVLSIPVTSIAYTSISLLVPVAWRQITLSIVFVAFSLIGVVRNRGCKKTMLGRTITRFDLRTTPVMVVVILFFAFSIAATYPQMSLIPGLDIVNHYKDSLLITSNPYRCASNYPWFILQLSVVNTLSRCPMEIHQTSLACLSLMLIFSFYIMTHVFSKGMDKRLPALTTAIWALFSGLGWVYIVREKIVTPSAWYLSLLTAANDKTYWDIGYGQGPWLWLWLRPITLGFIFMFTLLYLLRREDIQRRNFLFIFSILVTSLAMVHIPELFLLSSSILLVALMAPTMKLRIRDASLSTFLGVSFTVPLLLLYHSLLGLTSWNLSLNDLILLLVISAASYILARRPQRPYLRYPMKGINALIIGFSLVYLVFFATWFLSGDKFSVTYVAETMAVPSFIYPVLLGIVGFLALQGFALALKRHRNHPIVFFACMFLTSILIGKAITIINANFFYTSYWERRVIPVLFSASCLLASLALMEVVSKFDTKQIKKVLVGSLVVFLVIGGLTSTLASIELWSYIGNLGSLTGEEIDAISYLYKADPRSPLLTFSNRSYLTANFAPLGWVIDNYRHQLWSSKYPELPLSILSSMNSSSILFIDHRDLDEITKNGYANGYISSHLLNLAPETYSNTETNIYEIPSISPPSPNSDVVLVVSEKDYTMDRFAYDLLSLGKYNYTVALISDFNTIRAADVLIFPTEDLGLEAINSTLSISGKKIMILNIDGYGHIASKLFSNPGGQNVPEHEISSQTISLDLPVVILVQPLLPLDNGEFYEYKVLANYEGDSDVPFAVSAQDPRGFELIYLNVYPLIQKLLLRTDESRQIYPILGELLRLSRTELPSYYYERKDPVRGGVTTFSEALLKGDVTIKSSFGAPCDHYQNLTVYTDESSFVLTNARILSFMDFKSIEIRTSQAEMQDGIGLYSNFTVDDPTIIINGQTPSVVVSLLNGTTRRYSSKGNLTVKADSGQLPIIARLPEIQVQGNSYFKTFYALGELTRVLRTLGQNLTINGEIGFFTDFADSYTVTYSFNWQGSFTRSKPFLQWDEQQDLIIMILGLVLVSTLFLAYDLRNSRRKLRPRRSTNSSIIGRH